MRKLLSPAAFRATRISTALAILALAAPLAACAGTYENGPPPNGTQIVTPAPPAPPSTASTAMPDTSNVAFASPSAAASASNPSGKREPRESPKSIVGRHILIQWMGTKRADAKIVRTRDQAHAVAEEVLKRLKAGESFTRLVIDFSDEPNAGQRGGSLGRFHRGDMDKEFEAAAFALAPGETSGIVETPFGFHIIQRLE